MSVSIEGERRRRRRKRWDPAARIAVFCLGFLLIFSEICLLSSAEKLSHGGSRWSPARKARIYGSRPYHARASSPSEILVGRDKKNYSHNPSSDKSYEEDKRLVHTGPNPLHN